MKKYELTENFVELDDKKLFRIRAVRDFAGIKAGDLGGYVEDEKNLSHDGQCWISGDARIYGGVISGDARISGGVISGGVISGDARIYGGVISGDARISGGVIYGGVISGGVIYGGVIYGGVIYGGARIYGGVIYGGARIYGGVWNSSPLQIQGTRHFLTTSSEDEITIGCETRSIEKWLSGFTKIGRNNGYTEAEIEEYHQYILLAADFLRRRKK